MFSFFLSLIVLLTGCTYSISQAHTEASGSDVTESQADDPSSVNLSVPLTPKFK